MKKSGPLALIPIGVFVVFYLSLGIIFEYVMKIPMGFYNVPVVVAFLIALFVAVLQTKGETLDKKFEIMGQGVGDKNIITMLLIFMLAGIFVGVVGRSSAESVAYFMLSVAPPRLAVVVLFLVSCFVSTAMGTSVGTITLIPCPLNNHVLLKYALITFLLPRNASDLPLFYRIIPSACVFPKQILIYSEKLLPLPKNLYELNITLLPFCLYSLFFTYILHF